MKNRPGRGTKLRRERPGDEMASVGKKKKPIIGKEREGTTKKLKIGEKRDRMDRMYEGLVQEEKGQK